MSEYARDRIRTLLAGVGTVAFLTAVIWFYGGTVRSVGAADNINAPGGTPVLGNIQYKGTVNNSNTITTGLTYQLLLAAAGPGTSTQRNSLTIENNNASSDACYLFIGKGITAGTTTTTTNVTVGGNTITAAQASIYLGGDGGSYTRYWPNVPSDAIYATCATTGDSLYVDYQ